MPTALPSLAFALGIWLSTKDLPGSRYEEAVARRGGRMLRSYTTSHANTASYLGLEADKVAVADQTSLRVLTRDSDECAGKFFTRLCSHKPTLLNGGCVRRKVGEGGRAEG